MSALPAINISEESPFPNITDHLLSLLLGGKAKSAYLFNKSTLFNACNKFRYDIHIFNSDFLTEVEKFDYSKNIKHAFTQ